MNKKIVVTFLVCLFLFISVPAYAETMMLVNGQVITFDVPPVIENSRTLVPVRQIFEALGAVVNFDPTTSTVTAIKANTVITLEIGGNAYVNGQPVDLDVPAKIISWRTLVPLRFISESLGAAVDYDEATKTVIMYNNT